MPSSERSHAGLARVVPVRKHISPTPYEELDFASPRSHLCVLKRRKFALSIPKSSRIERPCLLDVNPDSQSHPVQGRVVGLVRGRQREITGTKSSFLWTVICSICKEVNCSTHNGIINTDAREMPVIKDHACCPSYQFVDPRRHEMLQSIKFDR